jgi:transcriptional regulator with XRE-family HTH domain
MSSIARIRKRIFEPVASKLQSKPDVCADLDRDGALARILDGGVDLYLARAVELGRSVGLELTFRWKRSAPSSSYAAARPPTTSARERVLQLAGALTAIREARGIPKKEFAEALNRTTNYVTRFDGGTPSYNIGFVIEYATLLDLELAFVDPGLSDVGMPSTDGLSADLPFDPPDDSFLTAPRQRKRDGGARAGAFVGIDEMVGRRNLLIDPVRSYVSTLGKTERKELSSSLPPDYLNKLKSNKDSPLDYVCTILAATGHVATLVPLDKVVEFPTPSYRPPTLFEEVSASGRRMALEIMLRIEEVRRRSGFNPYNLRRLAGLATGISYSPEDSMPRISTAIRLADVFDLRLIAVPAESPLAGGDLLPDEPTLHASRLASPYRMRSAPEGVGGEARDAILQEIVDMRAFQTQRSKRKQAEAERLEGFRRRRRELLAARTPSEQAVVDDVNATRKRRRARLKAAGISSYAAGRRSKAAETRRVDVAGSPNPPVRSASLPPRRSSKRTATEAAAAARRDLDDRFMKTDKAVSEALATLRGQLGDRAREIAQHRPSFAALIAATTRTGQALQLSNKARSWRLHTRRPLSELRAEWTAILDGVLVPLGPAEDPDGSALDQVRTLSPDVSLKLVLYCLGRAGCRLSLA